MKRLATALVAAGLAAASIAGAAYAAKKPEPAYSPEQMKKGTADAPSVVSAAGLTCTVVEAAHLGQNQIPDAQGKKQPANGYELACKDGPGYIVAVPEKAGAAPAIASTCIQAKSAAAANKGQGNVCKLPANADLNAQIQPTVNAAGLKCTVNNAIWVGGSATQKVDRYEVSCTEGGGYMIDAPQAGSTFKLAALSCFAAEGSGYDCKLTPKEARLAPIQALAQTADKSCQMSGARQVGVDPTNNDVVYEIACTGRAGFMVETTAAGAFVKSTDCARAARIAGGCKLTDTATIQAAASHSYDDVLKANHVACTVQEMKVIGIQANREVVEFRCPERPYGLMTFIPEAGASSKFEAADCISARTHGVRCTLEPRDSIKAMLTKAAAAHGTTCNVSNYDVLGPSGSGGEAVELACSGGTGYVVDLAANRTSVGKAQTCAVSKKFGDACTLPENAGK